ncbi:hypothetical protein SpCBS45565_g05263 [Spizellomyces sp. 'palustris']|nr:hypothetical protein SpCBS45565_g05263 [Spizellomyces sp. 'palustris']
MLLPPSIYPIHGILYFVTHPTLWLRVICALTIALFFAVGSTVVFFVFTLKPQAHALDRLMPDWLAWILAVFLVLVEICAASLLFVAIALPTVADQLFDDVVSMVTGCPAGEGSCARGCWLGCAHAGVWIVYLVVARLLLLLVTAPLHLLPIFGTILFLLLNGYLAAWAQHLHWFDLRGFGFTAGKKFVRSHRQAYTSFGSVAVLLEMVPVIGMLFMFTNIVGSALWAIDMERSGIMPALAVEPSEV